MPNKITYTTRSKEKNPSQDPQRQINSLAIVAGRLLAELIRERRVVLDVEAAVSLSLETNFQDGIMENIVSIQITQLGDDNPIPGLNE